MVVFAPIPSANERIATIAKLGASDKQAGAVAQVVPKAGKELLASLPANGHRLQRSMYGRFQSGNQLAVSQIPHQDSIGLLLSNTGYQQLIVTIVEMLAQFLHDLCFARRRKIQRCDCILDIL
jgi:hypothetical protein